MLRILVVGLVLLVAAMFWLPRPSLVTPPPAVATLLPDSLALPAVHLTDKAKQPFAREDLQGTFTLMFFGFTNCPDICPLTLSVLADSIALLEERAPGKVPAVLFVSVDPSRDSAEKIDAYLANFNSSFQGVTGPEAALAPWIETLGVTVHRVDLGGEHYNVIHNGTVFVLNPDAELVAVFGGTSHDAETIATDFLRIAARSGTP